MITYTVKEVANLLKVDEETVRRYFRDNKLNGIKLGRSWRITQEELFKFVKGE